ncbi:plasmid pRiA4b ORF-3 family protein [Virgibacillus sp. W0430]|uniref:plasmid pRiA4b ORF-3 family protein n=1 Tax=Virgibacillus sp. W0430 TaxID=3391580 RepID=UPI003F446B23
MLFHCTKKLLDHLKLKSEPLAEKNEGNALFSWHANVIRLNRRQSVVLMNDKNQYVIVLYGMRAKDFSRIHAIIEQAIRAVWSEEGLKESVIDKYLAQAGEVQFTKTKNRSLVARLNKACEGAVFSEREIDEEAMIQPKTSMHASRMLVGRGKEGYIHPNEALYEDLKELTGQDEIFSVRAVEMHVQLMLETKEIWRRLIVPLNRTFPQLHHILQTAFGWEDYHLHEFYIFDEQETGEDMSINHPAFMEEGAKVVVNLVDNEEAFAYSDEIPMKLEKGIKLAEYLPAAKLLMYIYDLGDDWRHRIDVTRVIGNYPANHPVCLDGKGDTPPEDVGGEGGYLEFLEIMNDPEHPDHEQMKQWASSQLFFGFELGRINVMLKSK